MDDRTYRKKKLEKLEGLLRTVGKQAPLGTMAYIPFLFSTVFFQPWEALRFICCIEKRSVEIPSMIQEFPVS